MDLGPIQNQIERVKGLSGMLAAGDIMRSVLFGSVCTTMLWGAVLYLVKDPAPMNFIETYFGFSPDNGHGSMEILLIVALAVFVAAIGLSLRPTVK